ncbi:hypothetical protein LCGC14_1537570, partial [marine sediment metagenome]
STSNTPVRSWRPDLNEMASIKPGVIQYFNNDLSELMDWGF